MDKEMKIADLEAVIEAILFTMGEAVELERIAAATEQDEDTCRHVIRNMMDRYAGDDRGIQIIELDGAFQMCTKSSMYEYLVKIAHVPKKHVLTDVLLETLSIIAYKQPITKLEIEKIRGVKCDHAINKLVVEHIRGVKSDHVINKLVEYKLICEVGRLDAPGRPILFATTEEFLRNFGIESLEDLPVVNPEKVEDFKLEAEEEIQLELDIELDHKENEKKPSEADENSVNG